MMIQDEPPQPKLLHPQPIIATPFPFSKPSYEKKGKVLLLAVTAFNYLLVRTHQVLYTVLSLLYRERNEVQIPNSTKEFYKSL